jgi:hypothetical protein
MHTHTERAVVRAANKKGRTKTNPSSARCGFFLSGPFIERAERLFGEGVSSRRQKQTEILFANPNPGKKEKFPSRDKETVVKKGVV